MGLCAFFVLISHANLQTGQQQLLLQTQVTSLPLARSLHTIPHYSNKAMCLCLQVAAKPASLSEGSDSHRERAYPATSAVVPQVSLPHLYRRFSPFLPGQLCGSWTSSWSATVHSPAYDSESLLAKVQHHSPRPKLSCPHFSIELLQHVLLHPREWLQRVTAAKTSWFGRYIYNSCKTSYLWFFWLRSQDTNLYWIRSPGHLDLCGQNSLCALEAIQQHMNSQVFADPRQLAKTVSIKQKNWWQSLFSHWCNNVSVKKKVLSSIFFLTKTWDIVTLPSFKPHAVSTSHKKLLIFLFI